MHSTNPSLVVVGGGAIGLCVALFARRAGMDVTVLERDAKGHDCCSLGNAGMIVPSHLEPLASPATLRSGLRSIGRRSSPIYVPIRLDANYLRWAWQFMVSATRQNVAQGSPVLRDLLLQSRACYEELADQYGNEFGLERSGILMLCKTQQGLDQEAHGAEFARSLGIDASVLDRQDIAARETGLAVNGAGGVLYPLDHHLTPQRLMALLERELGHAGVQIRYGVEAIQWVAERRKIKQLVTSEGTVEADEFVLATGAWTPKTTKGLSLRLPVEAGKGYSLTLANPSKRPSMASMLVEARIAVTPMMGSLRFAGTMEFSGLDLHRDPARLAAMTSRIPEYYPDFTASELAQGESWCGLRPCTPDGLPYIGRTANLDNFSVCTGHAMLGISLAPVTGRLMAGVLTGDTSSPLLAALRPDRFG